MSQVEDSLSVVDALNLNEEDSKINEDECPLNRLFVGIIDINKWEEDAQCLYSKLLEEGDNFKTEFWRELLPVEVQKILLTFQVQSNNWKKRREFMMI